MMSSSDVEPASGPLKPLTDQYYKSMRQYQILLDKITPFVLNRWLSTAGLFVVFLLRIVVAQGVCVFSSQTRSFAHVLLVSSHKSGISVCLPLNNMLHLD